MSNTQLAYARAGALFSARYESRCPRLHKMRARAPAILRGYGSPARRSERARDRQATGRVLALHRPPRAVESDTQQAIKGFERERNLPITGQLSEQLIRELSAVTGRT
jgi:hypothetical protein